MILDIHEKLDVSPEWFEEQAKSKSGWAERLCQLLAVYNLKDKDGARKASEKMIAAGVDKAFVDMALE